MMNKAVTIIYAVHLLTEPQVDSSHLLSVSSFHVHQDMASFLLCLHPTSLKMSNLKIKYPLQTILSNSGLHNYVFVDEFDQL